MDAGPIAIATVLGGIAGGLIVQLGNTIINVLNTNHKNRMEDNSKAIKEQSELIQKLQTELDKEIKKSRNYDRAVDWILDAQIVMKQHDIQIRPFILEPSSQMHTPLPEGAGS